MERQEAPINNTHFSSKEFEHFKGLLKKEQKDAKEKIKQFKSRIQELEEKLSDTTSSAAHHQGNIASSEEEREKYYTLIEKQKEKIDEIKMAFDRIESGNYGICNVTGEPIQKERLEIKPHAKYSVDAMKSANKPSSENINVQEAV